MISGLQNFFLNPGGQDLFSRLNALQDIFPLLSMFFSSRRVSTSFPKINLHLQNCLHIVAAAIAAF